MKVINIKENINYLKEYVKLCSLEWGSKKIVNKWKNM